MAQAELKHVCKFCSKSFACGRSLGGHMRSHMVNDISSLVDGTQMKKKKLPPLSAYLLSNKTAGVVQTPTYVLREKSRRSHVDKTCKDCGEAAASWKDLLDHMKIHCVEEEAGPVTTGVSSFVMDSHSDTEAAPSKRKRSKRRRASNSSNNPSSSSISQPSSEQEEVAMCLIMLSRDSNSVKKKDDEEFETSKFECTTCNKMFHSYQALGGHRASHKKIKGCFATKSDSENSVETESFHDPNPVESEEKKLKAHECPICFKAFPSGQALGGHKRAHLIEQGKEDAQAADSPKVIRSFIDLNLPAPEEGADLGFHQWGKMCWIDL